VRWWIVGFFVEAASGVQGSRREEVMLQNVVQTPSSMSADGPAFSYICNANRAER
jgi:hypothetical protein